MVQEIMLLILIILAGILNFQIYYAFTLPENQRRETFRSLTEEQMAIVKQQMTAEHYFKLLSTIREPIKKKK